MPQSGRLEAHKRQACYKLVLYLETGTSLQSEGKSKNCLKSSNYFSLDIFGVSSVKRRESTLCSYVIQENIFGLLEGFPWKEYLIKQVHSRHTLVLNNACGQCFLMCLWAVFLKKQRMWAVFLKKQEKFALLPPIKYSNMFLYDYLDIQIK